MNLKKQLFFSFLLVSLVPLIIITTYLFQTNVKLAFDLYKQNLLNSTAIQNDFIDNSIERFMSRTARFADSSAIRKACKDDQKGKNILELEGVSQEIMLFTSETLDTIAVFSLQDVNGNLLFSSDPNIDMETYLSNLDIKSNQYVSDKITTPNTPGLSIVTPVIMDGQLVGRFVSIFSNEYFLQMVGSYEQIEGSDTFIYCRTHDIVVTSENEIDALSPQFIKQISSTESGNLKYVLDKEKKIGFFREIEHTSWILVHHMPVSYVYSRVFSSASLSLILFIACIFVVILLSHYQSKRMLIPLGHLLRGVERFFVSGEAHFRSTSLSCKSEIGYLAKRFEGMVSNITAAQEKLRESNYLYEALLNATYGLCITIDYENDRATSSLPELFSPVESPGRTAPQTVMALFDGKIDEDHSEDFLVFKDMVYGRVLRPTEAEICYVTENSDSTWFRVIAVPVTNDGGRVQKMVLHFEDTTMRKQEEFELIKSSQRDPLCGLLNKIAFLTLAKKYAGMKSKQDAVFFIDLDNFKKVNDTFGHAEGDSVLIHAAEILLSLFRPTDFVARYGGDEFVVFAPGIGVEHAEQRASRLIAELYFCWDHEDGSCIEVTCSVGIAMSYSTDLEEIVQSADAAMYQAKQDGKSQYRLAKGLIG